MRRFSVHVLARPMPLTGYRLAVTAAVSALVVLALQGCSSGGATSGPTKPAATSVSSPASQTYASKAFVLPLTVTVDASLKSPPDPDSRHLLSWDAANSPDNRVRFLMPTNVYRPSSTISNAPPENYLPYLQGLASHGAKLSNVTKVTVDGHPATLMTATSTGPPGVLDGTLGFPSTDADQAEGCFGIQPDLSLRIAVIPLSNTTLLAWARTSRDNPDGEFFAMFEGMLNTVTFR
jgi:hypothetical protein